MSIAASTALPTLLFAAFAAITVAGCGIHIDLDDNAVHRTETDTVSAADLTGIDISTHNGAVVVQSGPTDEIQVRTRLVESDEGDAAYSIDTVNDRLILAGHCDSGWMDECRVSFEVDVPADLDVAITTDNGKVTVDGIVGNVHVETDNGAIEGAALRSSSFEAHTDNGRIRLDFDGAPATLDTETDNGAIALRLPDGELRYDVDASTGNGSIDIDVRTDPAAEHRVQARSDNGSIDVEYLTVGDS